MRLDEQGSICDFCGKEMKPHEKYIIKYEKTSPDKSKKVVISAKSCTYKALDLCDCCFLELTKRIESKIFYPVKPHIAFMNKCKKILN